MEGRPSPRKAIQSWLAQADYNATERRHPSRAIPSHPENISNRHEGVHTLTPPRNSLGVFEEKRQTVQLKEAQRGSDLAERFDLNTPFRHMEARNAEGARQLNEPFRHRKRPRSSSTSTYLEPAVLEHVMAGDGENVRKNHSSHGRQHQAISTKHEKHQECQTSGSDGSLESQATLAQQSCRYERRPRRKTKEDRYELKQERGRKRPEKYEKKGTRKQPGKAKTGASLLHDFTARNVASERLTLRTTSKLGLFNKGRASTAITRKGLPDLSFSEMTFLKPHRDTNVELSHTSKNKRLRTEKRATDVNDEISRFFKAAELPSPGRNSYPHHRRAQPSPRRHSSSLLRAQLQQSGTTSSPMPSPTPLTKSFLGFGIPGRRPDMSVRLGSTGRSSMSPSKHQLYQSPICSDAPLTWSASPNLQSSVSRPREFVESTSTHSKRLAYKKSGLSRTGTERSVIPVHNSLRTQLHISQEHHLEKRVSPSTSPELGQRYLSSRSTSPVKVQEQIQAESCQINNTDRYPPTIDTPANVNQSLAQTAKRTLNTLASETEKYQNCQPATTQEDSNNVPSPTDELGTSANIEASQVAQPEDPATLSQVDAQENSSNVPSLVDKAKITSDIEANQSAQPEDSATFSQFATDLNNLLGKWKGKVTIPDNLSGGIRLSGINGSNIDRQDSPVPDTREPDYSIGAVKQDAAVDIEGRQATLRVAQGQRPATNETSSTTARISGEHDRVPSRISRARSQRSWIAPRSSQHYRYKGDVQSPFQDSTYSTCGTRSIYEQQMEELPFSQQFDDGLHRNDKHPIFTDTRIIHRPVAGRPNIEPPPLSLRRQSSTQLPLQLAYTYGPDEPEGIQYLALNAPVLQSGVMESKMFDHGRSVEASYHLQGWLSPTRSCHQTESSRSPVLHHIYPRNHFQRYAFGDEATAEASMHDAMEDPDHSEGALAVGDVTLEEADDDLVGFWKPNRLY